MKVISIVPVKLQNKRLPGKNLKLLNGKPLLFYILETIENTKSIDKNYIYCSDDSIKQYLQPFRKTVFLKRDKKLDLDSSNSTDILNAFVKEVDSDIYVNLHVTAPFTTVSAIESCINAVKSSKYDSAFTAIEERNFAWIKGKPNYNTKHIPRTQDVNPILFETSGVYAFTKASFFKTNSRIGKKPYICIVSKKEAVDIDEITDFNLAEFYLSEDKKYEH